MLFIFVPSLIIITSVALAGRVIYKKIPTDVAEWNNAVAKEDFGPTFYQKALAVVSEKSKKAILSSSTKLVYKLKITSLRTDNFFTRLLNEIKSHKDDFEVKNEGIAADSGYKPPVAETFKAPEPFRVEITPVKDPEIDIGESDVIVNPTTAESEFFLKGERSSFAVQEQQLINQLAYNSKDVSAYKRLGWLYMENNKPIEARQAFKMAIKLGSKDKMIMAKLLEVGGVLHKEGTAPHPIISHHRETVLAGQPIKAKELKRSKVKIKKLKVKKV